jgi:hypothetical protein
VKKTNRAVVAHEAVTRMGFGAEVAAVLQYQAFDWLDAPIERVGAKFAPLPFAPVMENFVVPHAEDVLAAIKRTVGKARRRGDEVILPRLGQGMESGTIVRWLKSEGEPVEKGEPLFELDTDKVTQEVEAEAAGVLLKIAVSEGEVPVGQTVAFIGEQGEDVPEVAAAPLRWWPRRQVTVCYKRRRSRSQRRRLPETAGSRLRHSRAGLHASAESTWPRCMAPGRRGGSSPRTSRVPRRGSAAAPANNRLLQTPVPAGEVERVPLTNIRKTIARRLTEAWQIPVFQLQRPPT